MYVNCLHAKFKFYKECLLAINFLPDFQFIMNDIVKQAKFLLFSERWKCLEMNKVLSALTIMKQQNWYINKVD